MKMGNLGAKIVGVKIVGVKIVGVKIVGVKIVGVKIVGVKNCPPTGWLVGSASRPCENTTSNRYYQIILRILFN